MLCDSIEREEQKMLKRLNGVTTKTYQYGEHDEYEVLVIENANPTRCYPNGHYEAWLHKPDCGCALLIDEADMKQERDTDFLRYIEDELNNNTTYNYIGWYEHEADGLTDHEGYYINVLYFKDGVPQRGEVDCIEDNYLFAELYAKNKNVKDRIQDGEVALVKVWDVNDNLLSSAVITKDFDFGY